MNSETTIEQRFSLKELLMAALQLMGVNFLCKRLTRKSPRIIMFHKIYPKGESDRYSESTTVDRFERIVAYLVRNYNLYTLKELAWYFSQHGAYPENAVVLTFDDGFQSVLSYALPVLNKYNAPATVFICPELVNENSTIWSEIVFDAFEHNALIDCDYERMLGFLGVLKSMSSEQRNREIKNAISSEYLKMERKYSGLNRQLLDWNDIRKLVSSNLIEIGSHSMTHPILANEIESIVMREINESKEIIEKKLGQTVVSFCYPNGQEDDCKPSDISALKASGYQCAVTAVFGFVDTASNIFLLPRFGGDFSTFRQGRKYIDGVELIQRRLLEKIF